jgi:hypothetical protein
MTTQYTVSLLAEEHTDYDKYAVKVTRVRVNPEQWEVSTMGNYLGRHLEAWEFRPRTIVQSTWDTRQAALDAATQIAPYVEVNGILAIDVEP